MIICYVLEGILYVNVTNQCTNSCSFCVRQQEGGISPDLDLWLEREPTAEEIIEDLKKYNPDNYGEVVFCGYGEPLIRLNECIAAMKFIKENYKTKIRVNTNGHANLIHQKDVTPMFENLVDAISISLNAKNAEQYEQLCGGVFGKSGFDAMLDFTKKCKQYIPKVLLSVVDVIPQEDIAECRQIADELGVEFKIRAKI